MTAVAGVGEKLRAIAQELREHPERWTQGVMARGEDGDEVDDGRQPSAVCWCTAGLIDRSFPYSQHSHVIDLIVAAIAPDNPASPFVVPDWNDSEGRTAAEVADLFDRAAQLAEASP
jgi:hypothetical protein